MKHWHRREDFKTTYLVASDRKHRWAGNLTLNEVKKIYWLRNEKIIGRLASGMTVSKN